MPATATLQRSYSNSRKTPFLHALRPDPQAQLATLALELTSQVADAADADEWAVAVVRVSGTGAPDFEGLVPRAYLEATNAGRSARYRMTLVLQTEDRDLGILRLGTVRPDGFNDLEVARAKRAARGASLRLDEALADLDEHARNNPGPRAC
jgi:hypothetical protein